MRSRFHRVIVCGLAMVMSACAQSAIGMQFGQDEDSSRVPPLDAEVTVTTERADASQTTRDAAPQQDGHVVNGPEFIEPTEDAGSVDAGIDASLEDASVDASVEQPDTATPPEVDAGIPVEDAGVVDAGSAAPDGCSAQSFEGRSYLFCTQQRNWIDARNVCIKAKLDIVVVDSAAESMFVAGNGDSWIGATDIDGENHWVKPAPGDSRDYSGADITYTNWIAGQPDNTKWCAGVPTPLCIGLDSDEDCAMARAPDGQWNDSECSRTRNFVCEQL